MRVIIYPVLVILVALACNLIGGGENEDQRFTVKVLDNPVRDMLFKMGDVRADQEDLAIDIMIVEFYSLPIVFQESMPHLARVEVNGLECHLLAKANQKQARLYYFFSDGKWKEARARLTEASLQKGGVTNIRVIKALDEDELLPDEEIISPGNLAHNKRGNTIPFFVLFFIKEAIYF